MKNNILIIKHGALGDIVLAGPAFQAIREFHKNDYIICLTTKTYSDIFKSSPWVDEVVIDVKPRWYNLMDWLRLGKFFKKLAFDRVYDLQTSHRSNIYFYLFYSFKFNIWSGIAFGSKYRHNNVNRKKMHTYDRQKDQLKLCGIKYNYKPNWEWLSKNYNNVSILPQNKFAIIVPGASVHRKEKRWPQESYAQLIDDLYNKGVSSILLGTLTENKYINEIIDKTSSKVRSKTKNYAGKTNFKDIVYLCHYAKYAVGNDTGPMHLIASTSLRSIVLFGSDSDPNLCAPLGKRVNIIQKKDIKNIKVKEILNILEKI